LRAVDTNVVVRYLTQDEPDQFARACIVMEQEDVWIPMTVLLETEWVLRRGYRRVPPAVATAVHLLMGLPNVRFESPHVVSCALDWFERGMDFADALHLAAANDCDGLATFDRDFIKAAARLGAGNVAEP
jgi:predicted nucleic-acid-binding protein